MIFLVGVENRLGCHDAHHYNDRLLPGLTDTMSEAELHILKARLIG